jgi:hypothetical protein
MPEIVWLKWLFLVIPVCFHLGSAILHYRIAHIRHGYWLWYLAWIIQTTVVLSYAVLRIEGTFVGNPYVRMVISTCGAFGSFLFALCVYHIFVNSRNHS